MEQNFAIIEMKITDELRILNQLFFCPDQVLKSLFGPIKIFAGIFHGKYALRHLPGQHGIMESFLIIAAMVKMVGQFSGYFIKFSFIENLQFIADLSM